MEEGSGSSSKRVNLEVQNGGDQWQSVGDIHLLDDRVEGGPTIASSSQGRQQLPKSVKRLLTSDSSQRKQHYLYRHSPESQPNTNILILLHGAGDTHIPFDKLAQRMQLPQTATLSLSAKAYETLPFGLGNSWFQEIDYSTGQPLEADCPRREEGLRKATNNLYQVVKRLALDENWIIPERIFLLGYGAGATLIMSLCEKWALEAHRPLGGAICVAGGTNPMMNGMSKVIKTPILLMVGENDASFTPSRAQQVQDRYGTGAQLHIEPNKSEGMIQSPQEMKAVMEFLSQRLVRISSFSHP